MTAERPRVRQGWNFRVRRAAAEVRGLVTLAVLALVAGLAVGLVCAAFRLALEHGEVLRRTLVGHAHGYPVLGPIAMATGAAAATAIAAAMVRHLSPSASGSGIPHTEAVLEGALPPSPWWLVPIKFVGGFLAIGAGLALGREGPSVQMGAVSAHVVGRLFHRGWQDRRALIAGGAGAGLATAFNAPVAGAIFVLEELVGRFEPRMALVALGTSISAITVSQALLGNAPDFNVPELSPGTAAAQPVFLLFGLLIGLLAVVYNRSVLATLALVERIGGPIELRAAVIGGTVGLLGWFVPHYLGGGGWITQQALDGTLALSVLPALFLFRLVLGAVSYAAATPGGLFAPMLVLGAIAGLGFGAVVAWLAPMLGVEPQAFAVVGMGAFFAGVVRAPLTGIVLITEMTGSSSLLLPLLSACFGAMLVAEGLREPPIYAALRRRAARKER